MTTLLDFKDDFPGVAFSSELDVWKGICVDPNLLFKLENLKPMPLEPDQSLIDYRK